MSHFAAQPSARSRARQTRAGRSRPVNSRPDQSRVADSLSGQPRPATSRREALAAARSADFRAADTPPNSRRSARRESHSGPRHSARNHRPAHGERGHYTSLLTVIMFFVAVGITLVLPFGQYMGPWLPLILLGIPFLAGGCGTGCAIHCNRPGWGIANLAVAVLYLPLLFVVITLISGP